MMQLKLITRLSLILLLIASCSVFTRKNSNTTIDSWVRNNAHEIKTLEPFEGQDNLYQLLNIVGEASVVCLGEKGRI